MIELVKRLHKRFNHYIYDSSVDMKDRSFILFSVSVLIALFLAIPCGLIMQEPPMATISTLIGAMGFSMYVIVSFFTNKIQRAKIVISLVLVFIFLPAMFFTNGGVYGGTPIWLVLGTIYISMILNGRMKMIMLLLNVLMIMATWIVGYFFPDLISTYSRAGNYFDSLSGLLIVSGILFVLISFQIGLLRTDEKQKNVQRLFEQTATSLVNAIDAKDKYTHGHSSRVAEYSRKIAELSGMSEAECDEIYYVALLHDVGKIGIPEDIINKDGKLSDEEYEIIKKHPELGAQILYGISEYPNLSVGAHYHHERYDGKGYPDKLKGNDIPELARIISVADAYDAMTSKRSYRDAIPQQAVREEIVKGSGTQFDPKYAKIMQHLIDLDTEYQMKEKSEVKELSGKADMLCRELREEISDGILVNTQIRKISLRYEPLDSVIDSGIPAIVLFDSLDGRYHRDSRQEKELCYFEYAEILFDGRNVCEGARKIRVEEAPSARTGETGGDPRYTDYQLEAVRYRDHVRIDIDNGVKALRVTVALPDSSRYSYIGLTGEHCYISRVRIEKEDDDIAEDYIMRIAPEIIFLDGPVGDIPSVQIDGYRTAASEGIPLKDGLKVSFFTRSLPSARLIWHTAYVTIFTSANGQIGGEGYKEYALIRLDGENWEEGTAINDLDVNIAKSFAGWDAWKDENKNGLDCEFAFQREGDKITTTTENLGISITNVTTIPDVNETIYVALTGDQCVIMNIRLG